METPPAPTQTQNTASPATLSAYEKNKLSIAGALNAIGDVGLLIDGFGSKSIPFKLAGWLYTAGALVVTFFGTPNKGEQVRDLWERSAEFIQSKATTKNPDLKSAEVLQKRDTGVLATVNRAMRRYSGQIMLALYTLGAGAMLTHGINSYQRDKAAGKDLTEAKGTIGYGIASLTIKALSLGIKEDASQEKKASPRSADGIIGWFKEKPMRIFGYGSLITETMMGWRTYGKYKKSLLPDSGDTSNYVWSALTTGSYALSDLVIASTNKDAANAVGKLSETAQDKIENMMAQTIAAQPLDKQEQLTQEAAQFLRRESTVNGTAEQLQASLSARVQKMSDAWTDRGTAESIATEAQRA